MVNIQSATTKKKVEITAAKYNGLLITMGGHNSTDLQQ